MSRGYDYILAGGGSAACVAAWRLVKDKGARVLMLERGPARASGLSAFYLSMPAAWMKGIRGSPIVEMHQPVPQTHLNGRAPAVGQAANVTRDEDLAKHCRRTVKTNWHPVGTCRMGPEGDGMAVLDKQLRVRGIEGLRVIDASAMPFVPSGNTNAPTMALADRAMRFL